MSRRQGSSFGRDGQPILGSRCPRCTSTIEYDGNYWCSECPWVLPESPRGSDLDAFKVAYVLLMQQTGRGDEINVEVIR